MVAKESHLVRNSVVEETVKAWSDVRHVLWPFVILTLTYLIVPSISRALVLKLSNEFSQPSVAHSSSPNSKRKRSYCSPDPSKEAGPSRLPYNNGNAVGLQKEETYDRTKPKRTRRLSIEEDIIPSSDPEEQELLNPESSTFTPPTSKYTLILNLRVENPRVSCPQCSRNVPYNSINPHLDSNCKKFAIGDDIPGVAKPDSKVAWGSIFKGEWRRRPLFQGRLLRADHTVILEFITLLVKMHRILKYQLRELPRSLMAC